MDGQSGQRTLPFPPPVHEGFASVTTGIIGVLHFAIDGITNQQNAQANNIANEATPGYTATEVSFQQSLQQALAAGGPAVAQETSAPSTAPPSTNGNNVNLNGELVAAQSDSLHYQQVTDALNAQFRLIQGVTGGSFQ
jgi:flagellar basal-body rod protein FlgB